MNASDVLEGRYRLERLLGTGGMSEVWLASDERLGRRVAVKVLLQFAGADELVSDLEQEARVIARLQHPGVVALYDAGVQEGQSYLVMEYVQGASLRQLLEQRGRLQQAEAVQYIRQVADALDYAHAEGVVHCDIKPENILINAQGVAKIADFGVAESVSRTLTPEQARDILGTVAYLAPEVLQGAPATPASDIYSLGLTLYEAVAGRLPFPGTTAAAIAGQRLANPAPPLRGFVRDASPSLEAAVARAVSLSPWERFATAREFAEALERIQVAQPGPASAPPPEEYPGRPAVSTRRPTARVRRGAEPRRSSPRQGSNAPQWLMLGVAVALAVGIGAAAAFMLTGDGNGNGAVVPTPTAQPPTGITPTQAPTRVPTNEPTLTPTPTRTPTPTPTRTPSSIGTPTVPAGTPPLPSRTPTP